MAVTKFIPQIWSARLEEALQKAHVATNLVNRDYEGLITGQGDTVVINTIGDITVKNYTKNTDIANPDDLSTTDQKLQISQAKYFNFQVDDVDKVQANGDLIDKAMGNASYQLADVADQYLFGVMASGAETANVLPTVQLTASNIYEKIVALRLVLDKNNVPTAGRAIAIPPEAYALLLQDKRFVEGGGSNAEATVRNGMVGQVAGFTVYETNNLPYDNSTKEYSIIASVESATTYAEQIVETEAYRMEKRFADGIKGLHVYGAKVTDGTRIAVLPATF